MPRAGLNPIVRQVVRSADLPDPELLRRFAADRDEASFAALVHRHGPMVLDVCRSVLGRHADAEDAFQAAFLVLVRQAGSIRRPGSLAAWLHGVAYRTACKARSRAARRREHESQAPVREPAGPDDLSWGEVRRVVHEELTALGDRYREPLVLCYLRGLTQDQAADALGLSRAALKKRLERGREKLRAALTHRGLGPTAVLAAVTFPPATTAVPPTLESAVAMFATDPGAAPASVLNLEIGGSNPVFTSKLTASLGLLSAAALGFGLLGDPDQPGPLPMSTASAAEAPPKPETRLPPPADTDLKWLAGEWAVRHVETAGEPLFSAKDLDGARITFQGDRAEVAGFRVLFVRNFSFKLAPNRTPKEIDVTFLEGPRKGETFQGIYVTLKDELRICLRLVSPESGRPAGFVTSAGSTLYTFILEPTKAKGDPPAPAVRPGPPPVGAVGAPLDVYPRSDALDAIMAWHRKVGEREIRTSWFLRGDPAVAMVCTADLHGSKVTTSREVHDHASQSTKTRELSAAQVEALDKLAGSLPPSGKLPDLKNLLLITVSQKGRPKTFWYDRTALPTEVARLYDLTGAHLDTTPATATPPPRTTSSQFPELHGKVTAVLGSVNSFVPPEAGSAFRLDLNDVSKLTILTFGPTNKMSVPLPGPVVVESTHYSSNGAFRSMRLVSKKGTQSVTIDIVPKPGRGVPNAVEVWVVVESEVVQGVVRIDAAAEGAFPSRPRPIR